MSIRFLFRNERYIYANPYCIYNAYIKLKYVVPSVKDAALSPICLQRVNFMNTPLDNNTKIDSNDPLITKIRSDPQILTSIQEFSQLLQGKGVDLSTGQMPSMLQMAKLASDKEVNAKIMAINSQLTKAGITLDAQTIQKFMNWASGPKPVTSSTPKTSAIEESKVATAATAKEPVKQTESKMKPVRQAEPKVKPVKQAELKVEPIKKAEPKVTVTAATAKTPVKQAASKVTKEQLKRQPPKESVGFIAKVKSWIFGRN